MYWQTIQERFPVLPLDLPPIDEIELLLIFPKLGRVWFESTDKQQLIQALLIRGMNRLLESLVFRSKSEEIIPSFSNALIQLQSNRFRHNGHRQGEAEECPHFEEIYPKFA